MVDASGGFKWGRAGGEIALDALLDGTIPADAEESTLRDHALEAMAGAHRALVDEQKRDPRRVGLGVCATLVLGTARALVVASIGDTRAYVARQGTVTPVTRPDILANDWERLGKTAADAASFPDVVTRLLGGPTEYYVPSVRSITLMSGDAIVLTTRGLHRAVDDTRMAPLIRASDLKGTCDALHALGMPAPRILGSPTSGPSVGNLTSLVARKDGGPDSEPISCLICPPGGRDWAAKALGASRDALNRLSTYRTVTYHPICNAPITPEARSSKARSSKAHSP